MARVVQDVGWSSSSVHKYFLKVRYLCMNIDDHGTSEYQISMKSERFVSLPSQKDLVAHNAEPSIHGNGPVQVSLPFFTLLLDSLVVKTSKILGGRFPFNLDMQSGNMVGFSRCHAHCDASPIR